VAGKNKDEIMGDKNDKTRNFCLACLRKYLQSRATAALTDWARNLMDFPRSRKLATMNFY